MFIWQWRMRRLKITWKHTKGQNPCQNLYQIVMLVLGGMATVNCWLRAKNSIQRCSSGLIYEAARLDQTANSRLYSWGAAEAQTPFVFATDWLTSDLCINAFSRGARPSKTFKTKVQIFKMSPEASEGRPEQEQETRLSNSDVSASACVIMNNPHTHTHQNTQAEQLSCKRDSKWVILEMSEVHI